MNFGCFWVKIAAEKGIISPEMAEMNHPSLGRKKARLNTAVGLGSVGISYDDIGELTEQQDETIQRVSHPETWELIDRAKDSFEEEFNKEL